MAFLDEVANRWSALRLVLQDMRLDAPMALRAPCRFIDDRKSAFEVFILVSKIREVPPALAVR